MGILCQRHLAKPKEFQHDYFKTFFYEEKVFVADTLIMCSNALYILNRGTRSPAS